MRHFAWPSSGRASRTRESATISDAMALLSSFRCPEMASSPRAGRSSIPNTPNSTSATSRATASGTSEQSDRYWEVMNYLASDDFDAQKDCGENCLQTRTNSWLDKYAKGMVTFPTGPAPAHLGFLCHLPHMLEDMYNPFPICAEMSRVAKAGYVETPSPVAELCRGVDGDKPPSIADTTIIRLHRVAMPRRTAVHDEIPVHRTHEDG
jgi:hypothetical protein